MVVGSGVCCIFCREPWFNFSFYGEIMKKYLIGALLLGTTIGYALPAYTQKVEQICGTTKDVITSLTTQYSETPVLIGADGDEAIVLLFNKETTTFTLIRSSGNNSCVLVSGSELKVFPKKDDNSKVKL
jgi:hypothetical protein